MSASNSETCLANAETSSPSLPMAVESSSASEESSSTASVFSSRVALLDASSALHQPFLLASSFCCVCIFVISCSIIVRTLAMGSAAARPATAESTRLFKAEARCCRKRATLSLCGSRTSERRNAKAVLFGPACKRLGRCFPALPATASPAMMPLAFSIASISSCRSFWRAAKAAAFLLQVALRSVEYFSSDCFSTLVSPRSPSDEALLCSCLALNWPFSSCSFLDCASCASRLWTSISKAWRFFCSSFSRLMRSSTNLS
mmetsp:Transcript_27711/g.65126  ORF Transcript_27711/g.65126 Transcript_27711/m.65126 type:complete len:260 (+) Transcript_27711:652-1431(+)